MNIPEVRRTNSLSIADQSERGTAIVIALFVLALVGVFVALALSRTAAEASSVGNETSEARTIYAAQGSLETMTRNFNKVFETKLNPSAGDITEVQDAVVPGLEPQFDFNQEVLCTFGRSPDCQVLSTVDESTVVLPGGPYAGLIAIRDNWRLRTTATNTDGTEIELTRNILNNRIPIFQFGIFYNDDLELFRPPRFSFGGRVHSNRHFFLSPGAQGVYFNSRVTAAGHIITQSWRNGFTGDMGNNQTFIKNASADDVQLFPGEGSVLNGAPNIFAGNPDMPSSRINPNFATDSAKFDGNLQSQVPVLNLPLNVGANIDLVEMIKRGKETATAAGGDLYRDNVGNTNPVDAANDDNDIMRAERFANKTGIRVSLADSKAKLPGCASGAGIAAIAGACGVRLDGRSDGLGLDPDIAAVALPERVRGYRPRSMADGYQATRVNGTRLFTGGAREVWIKVETVQTNPANGAIITRDITQDILSLGVTEQAPPMPAGFMYDGYDATPPDNGTAALPSANITATTPQAASTGTDSRSVIKIQRFAIPGPAIPGQANPNGEAAPATRFSYPFNGYNFVSRYRGLVDDINGGCIIGCGDLVNEDPNGSNENLAHLVKLRLPPPAPADFRSTFVPFPIEMYDMREGYYFDTRSAAFYANFDTRITQNGVMSMIDIDVANLRRFLRGDFNGLFPTTTPFAVSNGNTGLRACRFQAALTFPADCDIPQVEGWVLYVSDRRGDGNFDGEYDMEDIYGAALTTNNGAMQLGEDLDGPALPALGARFGAGVLDGRYIDPGNFANCLPTPVTLVVPANCEAPRYSDDSRPDRAAVNDHPYYRRGVRLINGTTLPGIYDSVTPANTRGFTIASENGIYVQGNYNATNVTAPPATANTPFDQYFPFNQPTHVPASVVADGVTILSNAWNDAQSFRSPVTAPYDQSVRLASETHMRFAMISGDTIASRDTAPNQGGISPKLNGGVHNFKRFLERWTGQRLNYAGSLINLFNSRNNNGSFKCCNTVYNPPDRNWVFDSTFLDPGRLPPGTPFFQYVQTTGFQRTTN